MKYDPKLKLFSAMIVLALAVPMSFAYGEEAPPVKDQDQVHDKQPAVEQAEKDDGPTFMRIRRDDNDQPLSLDTAIVTYESAGDKNQGVVVELVGAVHVGDAEYYSELNDQFEKYDVLLYELVAPEGARIPKGGRKEGGGLINALQGGMKSLLDLEHQLEQIDYTKNNFVHADMSPEEFAKTMKDRGESFLQMFLRAMGQSAAMQAAGKQPISDSDILFALFSKDRPRQLKKLLAGQFENVEAQMDIFQGPEGSTIITERNKKCFEVLEKEIAKGHKKIGVFYGAGHLADMEKRLEEDFGMKRTGERWVVAWDLTRKTGEPREPKAQADDRDPFEEPATPLKKAG